MNNNAGYIISNSGNIMIMINDENFNVASDHMNYAKILDALRNKRFDEIPNLADIGKGIVTAANDAGANGNIEIKDGLIRYKGFIVDTTLTRRILTLISGNYPFEPMLNFFQNLMENPSARALGELYNFLEVNNIPITDDGCFLAYKRVRDDYMDFYTGNYDNHVGKEVSMDRKDVIEDKDQTCAQGLHACSLSYLPEYHGGQGRVIIIKINPADVVSIPADYNNAKMRVCRYWVIGEVEDDNSGKNEVFDKPLYGAKGETYEPAGDDEDDDGTVGFGDDGEDGVTGQDRDSYTDDQDRKNYTLDDDSLGTKPDGKAFWNGRDATGKFRPKLGRKPDGKAFWNKRDRNGKFVSKKA